MEEPQKHNQSTSLRPTGRAGRRIVRRLFPLLRLFSSLRNRNYRLYFWGQYISLTGGWIQHIAMGWLVYRMTDSVLLLTLTSFLNMIPNLLLTPVTGVLSDRFDRFKILVTTQSLFALQALVLAVLTLRGEIELWQILTLSTCAGIISAVEAPARQSFYTRLVSRREMSNAIAVNSLAINGSRFIGPPIGGFLISFLGEGYCFLINSVSYIAVLLALFLMHLPPFVRMPHSSRIWHDMKEGIIYIKACLPIRTLILLLGAISFFAIPFMSIVPAVARDVLGGDSQTLGFLMSSLGAGAVCAGLYLASRRHLRGLSGVVTLSALMLGVGLVLLSLVREAWLAGIICFPIGLGMIALLASCNTLLQTLVQERMRGRVMSFFTMASAGMVPLGALYMGGMAEWVGIQQMLLFSGLICLFSGGIYAYFRSVIRF